jgi:aspartyl-tRNA(Asn)/glutamyl-tRNA(Gln) amidotransferase subunit B
LEEDTGKLIHKSSESHIDFNRSGVPLLELVTEPDFKTGEDVVRFLKEVRLMAQYLEISNADMEKGSMRLEANVSVATDENLPNYKVELKNINSFKFINSAIEAEVARQIEVLERGEIPAQETRGYNENTGKTFSQRGKEEAKDYRYFPEPDLPPLRLSSSHVLNLRSILPELPEQKREKLRELSLPENYIEVLISDSQRIKYFEEALQLMAKHKLSAKELAGVMVNQNLDKQYPEPAGLVKKLVELTKKTYASMEQVQKAIEEVISEQEKAVKDFKGGKENVLGFLMGCVQKKLGGSGNPKEIQDHLRKNLTS